MMKAQLRTLVVWLACFCSIVSADNPCRFETDHGVIDISSLANPNNDPAFRDIHTVQPSGNKYSYNPCKPFTQGADCSNVAGCQISDDDKVRYPLGTQDTAKWYTPLGGNPYIEYSAGIRTLRVTLECADGAPAEFEVLGEDPPTHYKFRIKHDCACWNKCGGGPGPTPTGRPGTTTSGGGGGGGSGGGGGTVGGTIFVVLFFSLITVYFVGFALFYRFQQQKSGLDLIPHRGFWIGFGGAAKDGVVFCYQKVTGKSSSYQGV